MSRIDELIAQLCPDGVEFQTLGDIGEFVRGNGLQKGDLTESGVPAIHYGQIHTHYETWTKETKSYVSDAFASRLRKAHPGDLVIVTTSEDDQAVAKAVAWLGNEEAAISGDAYIYRHTLDPRYVAYFFQTEQFQEQKQRHITGTKVRRISGDSLAKIRIPVPPIEIQREIVKILDTFTELEARRQQYKFYRDRLLTFTAKNERERERERVRWMTLGTVSKRVTSGGTPKADRAEFYGGEIPWLRTQEVEYLDILSTRETITEAGFRNSSAKWIPANSVIVANSGAGVTRGRVAINKIPLTTNQHCCNMEIDPGQAHYRFVYHWLVKQYDDLRSRGHGNRSDLNAGIIAAYPIPIPSLAEQQHIVEILDSFDALVNDISIGLPAELKARRQQYEYYRDKLLTFEERVA